jgi:hypothetical protein
MNERRKIKRKYLMFYTRVFDADTEHLIGHLVDITPDGARLISEAPVPTGHDFNLKMELSGDIADQPFLEFSARSLWCKPDVNPSFYNTGFQLLSITPEGVAIIERIVEAYGFRDN